MAFDYFIQNVIAFGYGSASFISMVLAFRFDRCKQIRFSMNDILRWKLMELMDTRRMPKYGKRLCVK